VTVKSSVAYNPFIQLARKKNPITIYIAIGSLSDLQNEQLAVQFVPVRGLLSTQSLKQAYVHTLNADNAFRLWAFLALRQIEFNLLAFGQSFET